ncbi:hypothetical protein VTH82DRAFT_5935 [Thermothelomyces myriococcoides]
MLTGVSAEREGSSSSLTNLLLTVPCHFRHKQAAAFCARDSTPSVGGHRLQPQITINRGIGSRDRTRILIVLKKETSLISDETPGPVSSSIEWLRAQPEWNLQTHSRLALKPANFRATTRLFRATCPNPQSHRSGHPPRPNSGRSE